MPKRVRRCRTGRDAALQLARRLIAQMQPKNTFSDLNVPSAEVTPQASYVQAIARMAYVWGWPLVDMQTAST